MRLATYNQTFALWLAERGTITARVTKEPPSRWKAQMPDGRTLWFSRHDGPADRAVYEAFQYGWLCIAPNTAQDDINYLPVTLTPAGLEVLDRSSLRRVDRPTVVEAYGDELVYELMTAVKNAHLGRCEPRDDDDALFHAIKGKLREFPVAIDGAGGPE